MGVLRFRCILCHHLLSRSGCGERHIVMVVMCELCSILVSSPEMFERFSDRRSAEASHRLIDLTIQEHALILEPCQYVYDCVGY